MASHKENRGNCRLSRLWRLKSLGSARFLFTFFIRTTEARRVCCETAAARKRGMELADGREACDMLSLAMEAKHRSIGIMVLMSKLVALFGESFLARL